MRLIKLSFVLVFLGWAGLAVAGDAVSDLNGKMAFSYGDMDSNRGKNISGSISMPVSTNFGLQADGLYTHVSGRDFYGTGLQLFWRDSEKGLLGVSLAGIHEDVMDSYMGGVMGEYYLDSFTLGLNAGMAKIEYDIGAVPFISTDETKPYAGGSIGYYPMDNLLLEASYTYAFDNHLFQCKVEYQTPVSGLSFFADLAKGEHDYDETLFGIRYYFGKKKSLKQRHREDDPQNIVGSVLANIGTYGAEYNQKARDYNERVRKFTEALKTNPSLSPAEYNLSAPTYYESSSYGYYTYDSSAYGSSITIAD